MEHVCSLAPRVHLMNYTCVRLVLRTLNLLLFERVYLDYYIVILLCSVTCNHPKRTIILLFEIFSGRIYHSKELMLQAEL